MDLEFLKGGYFCINFQGKNVMIRVSHIGVEENFLKEIFDSRQFKQYEKLFKEAMQPIIRQLLQENANEIEPEVGQKQHKNRVIIMSSIDTYHAVSGLK